MIVFVSAANAQIAVSASLMDKDSVASIVNKRVSRRLGLWVATLTYRGHGTRKIHRSLVMGEMIKAGINAYDPMTAKMIVRQERKYGWRMVGNITMILAFAAANLNEAEAGRELMGPHGRKALITLLPMMPTLGERLIGQAPNSMQNITQLSQPESVLLNRGEAGAMRIFSSPYSDTTTIHLEIP